MSLSEGVDVHDEQRLARIEADLAVIRDRTEELKMDIRTFAPLVTQHAQIEERVSGLQRGLDGERGDRDALEHEVDQFKADVAKEFAVRDDRDRTRAEQARKDQLTLRVALAGLALTFGGLIVAVVNSIGAH